MVFLAFFFFFEVKQDLLFLAKARTNLEESFPMCVVLVQTLGDLVTCS